jgi:hypothetical protein
MTLIRAQVPDSPDDPVRVPPGTPPQPPPGPDMPPVPIDDPPGPEDPLPDAPDMPPAGDPPDDVPTRASFGGHRWRPSRQEGSFLVGCSAAADA